MKKLTLLLLSFCSTQFLFGQNAPGIEWEKSLGGSNQDEAWSVQEFNDGNFLIVGSGGSNDGDIWGEHGGGDYWVVRLNSNGDTVWTRCFGGSGFEQECKGQVTNDGGCVLVGLSLSNDGDVSGNHGSYDCWVIKLSSDGNLEWQKCLGGNEDDYGRSIVQTSDSGYIVASGAASDDGDVSGNHGDFDYWIVKLNSNGDTLWARCYGGSGFDEPYSISQTADNGFIVAGRTTSNDGDVWGFHGYFDYWIVKLNSDGDTVWTKCLGGSEADEAFDIIQTSDGGFVVCGVSPSSDGDVYGNHGQADYWLVKLNSNGDTVWTRCYGGSGYDQANSVQQTSDGGFILAGWTTSNDFDVSGFHGYDDYWIVKCDSAGSIEWSKCLGGSSGDLAAAIRQTNDGGYVIAGKSLSNDIDVTGNHGELDYWIVKLSAEATGIKTPASSLSFYISPNPTQGNFEITFPTLLQQHTTLSITNLLGQKLFSIGSCGEKEIPLNTSQQSFDFSQWQKGMYFITIRDENSFGEKQLVIQ